MPTRARRLETSLRVNLEIREVSTGLSCSKLNSFGSNDQPAPASLPFDLERSCLT